MSDLVKDPVCGMEIRPEDAAAVEDQTAQRFYFCSEACHQTFLANPHRYGHASQTEHEGHH